LRSEVVSLVLYNQNLAEASRGTVSDSCSALLSPSSFSPFWRHSVPNKKDLSQTDRASASAVDFGIK